MKQLLLFLAVLALLFVMVIPCAAVIRLDQGATPMLTAYQGRMTPAAEAQAASKHVEQWAPDVGKQMAAIAIPKIAGTSQKVDTVTAQKFTQVATDVSTLKRSQVTMNTVQIADTRDFQSKVEEAADTQITPQTVAVSTTDTALTQAKIAGQTLIDAVNKSVIADIVAVQTSTYAGAGQILF